MSTAAAPRSPDTGLQVHLGIVVLTMVCLLLQVYFAGRGLFVDGAGFGAHETMSAILHLVALVLLIATVAIPATRNKGDIIQAVVFLVLIVVQSALGGGRGAIAAFHPVVAVVIIGLVFGMLSKDRRLLTA